MASSSLCYQGRLHYKHAISLPRKILSTRKPRCILRAGNQLDGWGASRALEEQIQMMNNVDRLMEQVDRDVDKAMREAEQDMLRLKQQLQRQEREMLTNGQPIKIERDEGRTGSAYYEKVQIVIGGPGYTIQAPAPTPAPSFFSPGLVVAAIMVGIYTAITAAFFKNFDLTVYKDQGGWIMAPLWPFLLMFNSSFRNQFLSAIRGIKPSLDEPPAA